MRHTLLVVAVAAIVLVLAWTWTQRLAPVPEVPLLSGKEASAAAIQVEAGDWPWWRGPQRNGVAPVKQAPLKWSATENVVWQAPVPGRGHGSPIVVGDQVLLATAEPEREVQGILCLDRITGKQLWHTEVHKGGLVKGGHAKSSHASATPACDGARIFINFLNGGAIHTSALNREGKVLWQTKVADYKLHQGFGASPMLYGGLVLVAADHIGGGVLAALDRADGSVIWRQPRPRSHNYTSPIVLEVAGRDQVCMIGCEVIAGFDPLKGDKLWEIKGSTAECVASTVTDGKHIFSSGGYPRSHLAAVTGDGSGKIPWENNTRVYVPSMLVERGHLYAVNDDGIAFCRDCASGKERWKDRLDGKFSASLVLAGEHIYATNEAGRTYIFKANPERLDLIADNDLPANEVLASPAVGEGRLYLRLGKQEGGRRQEMLYCLGK